MASSLTLSLNPAPTSPGSQTSSTAPGLLGYVTATPWKEVEIEVETELVLVAAVAEGTVMLEEEERQEEEEEKN